jgi:SAM-dependent methyltransferase
MSFPFFFLFLFPFGFPFPFGRGHLTNQKNAQLEFPFVDLSWSQLMPAILKHANFDAALCLGGSLHHTDQLGVAELFGNVGSILAEGGLFIVEQRNYDRLFEERPQVTTHPCGWKYELRYQEPRTLYFHLTDVERDIDVNFQGIITFEQELLDIAREQGFNLEQKFFDYGSTGGQEQATWIEYVFRLDKLN